MSKVTPIESRKSDHIQINLEEDVRSGLTTGLERYRFNHRALPEMDLEEIDLEQTLFGRCVKAPILISPMTGGVDQAFEINRILAQAAQQLGLAMGIGSQRVALENPNTVYSYQVRQFAPDILLFANLGAIQLNYGFGLTECQRAVDMIAADALVLHFNALQEALQPDGDTRFSGLAAAVERICAHISVPVIAKEVGWGFSEADIRLLANAGIAAIDVAGAGGTSWSQVEMHRSKNERQRRIAAAFAGWGIPTSEAILNVRRTTPHLKIFASGGLRTGMDIAKSIALGAHLGSLAGPLLRVASQNLDETIRLVEDLCREIKICMFAAGAKNISALQNTPLIKDRAAD